MPSALVVVTMEPFVSEGLLLGAAVVEEPAAALVEDPAALVELWPGASGDVLVDVVVTRELLPAAGGVVVVSTAPLGEVVVSVVSTPFGEVAVAIGGTGVAGVGEPPTTGVALSGC